MSNIPDAVFEIMPKEYPDTFTYYVGEDVPFGDSYWNIPHQEWVLNDHWDKDTLCHYENLLIRSPK